VIRNSLSISLNTIFRGNGNGSRPLAPPGELLFLRPAVYDATTVGAILRFVFLKTAGPDSAGQASGGLVTLVELRGGCEQGSGRHDPA
jgi:hypothetical protein